MRVAVRVLVLGVEPAHLAEQLHDAELLLGAELAVERVDVDDDALGVAPVTKASSAMSCAAS